MTENRLIQFTDPTLDGPEDRDPEGLLARFPELTARLAEIEPEVWLIERAGRAEVRYAGPYADAAAEATRMLERAFLDLLRAGRIHVVDGRAREAPTRDPRARIAELLASGNRHVEARRARDRLIERLLDTARPDAETRAGARALGFDA